MQIPLLSHLFATRKKLFVVIALVVVSVLGFVGYRGAAHLKDYYSRAKVRRSIEQARDFMKKDDPQQALLALNVAMTTRQNDPEVWRTAAEFLEKTGSNQAVRIRQQILQIAPNSLPDRLALIITALQFKDFHPAEIAISETSPEQRTTPQFKQVAISYALATQKLPLADALLADLEKSNTNNDPSIQLLHAAVLLRHPKPEKSSAARATLTTLAENPTYRLPALRALTEDAMVRRDVPAALKLSHELATTAGATLSDQLNELNTQMGAGGKADSALFTAAQTRAATTGPGIAQFVQWLLVQKRAKEARAWLATLPEAQHPTPEINFLEAEIAVSLEDWDTLTPLLVAGCWGPIKPESVKLAMSAHTLFTGKKPAVGQQLWDEALAGNHDNLAGLRVLLRLAGVWRQDDAARATLFAIARGFPHETWAYQSLANVLQTRKDTVGLTEIMTLWRDAEPTNTNLKSDCALLTLLVQTTDKVGPAIETLELLHSNEAENPFYATGYAFGLWKTGRKVEALAVIDKLSPSDRAVPQRAPYLAVIYASAGRSIDAKAAIKRAVPEALLTEEANLLTQARAAAP